MSSRTLFRRRLINLMDGAQGNPIYLFGPTGYGKTELAQQWVELSQRPTVWFTGFSSPDSDEFIKELLKAICDEIPEIKKTLKPYQEKKSLSQDDLNELIRDLGKEKHEFTLIIEKAELIRSTHNQIARFLVSQLPRRIQLVLVTETAPSTSFFKGVGAGKITVISATDLAFTLEETQQLANQLEIELPVEDLEKLLQITRGWPMGIHIALSQAKSSNDIFSEMSAQKINSANQLALSAQRILATLEDSELDLVRQLCLLDEFDTPTVLTITQETNAVSSLTRLSQDTMVVLQNSANPPVFSIHPLLRQVLRNEALSTDDFTKVFQNTCLALVQRGQIRELAMLFSNLGGQASVSSTFESKEIRTILYQNLFTTVLNSSLDDLSHWIQLSEINPELTPLGTNTLHVLYELLSGHVPHAKRYLEDSQEGGAETLALQSIFAFIDGRLIDCFNFAIDSITFARKSKVDLGIVSIIALKLALSGSVIQDDDRQVSAISGIIEDKSFTSAIESHKEVSLNMQALISAQQGRLSVARNSLTTGISTSPQLKPGLFASFDAQLAEIIITAESGDHRKGIDSLEKLLSEASDARNYPMAIAALGRMAYLEVLLGRKTEAISNIAAARDLITVNKLSPELHEAIDIWEARVQYWLRDERRVEELLARSSTSYLMRAFKAGMLINSKTPNRALEITETFDLTIPRQELTYYLFRAHIFADSASAQLQEVKKAVEVGSKHGYFNHFLTQRSDVIQQYITLVAQSPTTFNERLARAAGERLNEMMVGNKEQALTRREADILRHLGTGLSITQIALDLRISKNTMKTHLKNIYRKLEVSGRIEAVEKGKKLFKV